MTRPNRSIIAFVLRPPYKRKSMELFVYKLMSDKRSPITCLFNTISKDILLLIRQHVVRYIPLLDEKGRVVEFVMFVLER